MEKIKVAYEKSYYANAAIGGKLRHKWCELILAYQVGQTVFVSNQNIKKLVGKYAEILFNYDTTEPTRSSAYEPFSWGDDVNVQMFETIHQARKAAKAFQTEF